MLSALAMGACSSAERPTQPTPTPPPAEVVLATSRDVASVAVVDPATARLIATLALPAPAVAASGATDAGPWYLAAGDLVAVDAAAPRVRRLAPLSTSTDSALGTYGGYAVFADRAIALAPDGAHLVVARAAHGDTTGIALLDTATLAVRAFAGPFVVRAGGLASVSPSATLSHGAVLAIAQRGVLGAPDVDWLFVLDPVTLAPVDSTTVVAPESDTAHVALLQAVPTADGTAVYVVRDGTSGVVAAIYDLGLRSVSAIAPLDAPGRLVRSRSGSVLWQLDAGDSTAAPGVVLELGPALQLRDSLNLRTGAAGGEPPMRDGAPSMADSLLYVLAGAPGMPAMLLVANAQSKTLERTIEIGLSSAGFMAVR